MDAGTNILDIGLCGTEEIYFSTFHLDIDGGIIVTASHNPIEYNGMKLVKRGAEPVSEDSGLREIQTLTEGPQLPFAKQKGKYTKISTLDTYIKHLFSFLAYDTIKPLKLVVNPGNGAAGHVIDAIEAEFNALEAPIEFVKINYDADGHFPNGIPNPLLKENRECTSKAVQNHNADLGIAWDGDFDRCFLFDEKGKFVEGYYIVGLLAQAFLNKNPDEKIIHDPRLTWNTIDIVNDIGGVPIQSKTGHAFMKQRMRQENAIYGGEMSAHHYFRDFAYCDSGMIPWMLIVGLISKLDKPLSALVSDREEAYPCSGEINYKIDNSSAAIKFVESHYSKHNPKIDRTDGVSIEFSNWRLNLRASNTEPLLRLNIESRDDREIVNEKRHEIEALLRTYMPLG
jgi:phosphomannomutase/phosphomannomutase/phosphoglucomutase